MTARANSRYEKCRQIIREVGTDKKAREIEAIMNARGLKLDISGIRECLHQVIKEQEKQNSRSRYDPKNQRNGSKVVNDLLAERQGKLDYEEANTILAEQGLHLSTGWFNRVKQRWFSEQRTQKRHEKQIVKEQQDKQPVLAAVKAAKTLLDLVGKEQAQRLLEIL